MREFLNNTSVGRIFIAAVFYYAKQKWFLSWFCSTSLCVCAFRFMFVLVLREWKRGTKRSRAKKVTCKKKVSVIKRLNIISRITNILIIFALLIFYFFQCHLSLLLPVLRSLSRTLDVFFTVESLNVPTLDAMPRLQKKWIETLDAQPQVYRQLCTPNINKVFHFLYGWISKRSKWIFSFS